MVRSESRRERGVDAVVVGGGPVGLAAAIHLSGTGARVVVVERRRPPIDKACGEGLMPTGVRLLAELGVAPPHVPIDSIRNLDGPIAFGAPFPCGGVAWGIRRTALHDALVDRAAAVGVDLRFGVRAEALLAGGVRTSAGVVEADWVIGADGLHSRVRQWAGIRARAGGPIRYGVRRHYAVAPWSASVEVHWGAGCEAYVTPVGPREVGIALLFGSRRRGRFDALLEEFPVLRARLAGAASSSTDRGAGPLHQSVERVVAGRVLLVGDASGYVDALTGEGLSLGFQHAAAVAEALARGRAEAYARAHRALGRVPLAIVRAMLLLERHPRLRRRVFRAFERDPATYGRFVGLNDGSVSPRTFGVRHAVGLARGLAVR